MEIKTKRKQVRARSTLGRRAQLKMGETIAIMFIFFMLLIAGAVFYMNLQRASMTQEIAQAFELRAVEIAQTISFLPEVQCTESNVIKASCFDLYKMIGMSMISDSPKGHNLYLREFGTTSIRLVKLYPGSGQWTLYDNPKESFTSAPVTNVPIMLYNTTADKYYFGVLQITTYS